MLIINSRRNVFFSVWVCFLGIIIALFAIVYANNYFVMNEAFASEDKLSSIYPSAQDEKQRAIQEVAFQYYIRGSAIQYEASRMNRWIAPEQITKQSSAYTVCSGFTAAVYNQAFGITPPPRLEYLTTIYGKNYYGNTNNPDIVWYDQSPTLEQNLTKESLLEKLIIGDVIVIHQDGVVGGHTMLVYDFIYDDESPNTKKDAVLLHANAGTSDKDFISNKVTPGLTWHNKLEDSTDVFEGAVRKNNLSELFALISGKSQSEKTDYSMIYRPLAQPNYYNEIKSCNDNSCSTALKTYSISEVARVRLEYSGIEIEKTVDKFNGSIVELGDVLTYSIAITNHSDTSYSNILIKDNIPIELVSYGAGNTFTSIVSSIAPGETKTISYSVTVKNNQSLIGQEIISTGTVAGIESATIKNKIGRNLTTNEETNIISAFNVLKDNKEGLDLINKVYEQALGKNLRLSDGDFVLGAQYDHTDDSAVIKRRNRACNPWFKENDVNALINTWSGSGSQGENPERFMSLNKNNRFADAVINHYYSAVNNAMSDSCDYRYDAYIKYYSNYYSIYKEDAQISERTVRIYPETLEIGDVLIYQNAGFGADSDPVTNEKGVYAFMWTENNGVAGFYGINSPEDGKEVNIVSGDYVMPNDELKSNLFTLYGKDYYAILRPSLLFNQTVSFNQSAIVKTYGDANFINIATTSGDGVITYASSNSNVAVVNQVTGEVTIKGVGEVVITAIASSTELQDEAKTSYTLTVTEAEQKNYLVIEGDKQIYEDINENKFALFKIDASFDKFQDNGNVYVDGEELNKQYYIAESGSTIIKLLDSYLSTLAVGEHSLSVSFVDGVATASFTIAQRPIKDEEKEVDYSDGKSNDESDEKQIPVPNTGDGARLDNDEFGFDTIILPICLILFCATIIVVKRKRAHRIFD